MDLIKALEASSALAEVAPEASPTVIVPPSSTAFAVLNSPPVKDTAPELKAKFSAANVPLE